MTTRTDDVLYRYVRLKYPYEVNRLDRKDFEKTLWYSFWKTNILCHHLWFHIGRKIREIIEGVMK